MSLEHLRNPGDFLERWTHHPDLFPKADRQGYGCRALRPALLLPRPRAPCQAPPPPPNPVQATSAAAATPELHLLSCPHGNQGGGVSH